MRGRDSKNRIFKAAREEFLEKGYQGVTMRTVAAKVDMTATALYRHYADKESLFDAIVGPSVQSWYRYEEKERERQFRIMTSQGTDAMWAHENTNAKELVDLLYEDFEASKILLCRSAGTKYENFLHEQIERIQRYTVEFSDYLRNQGVSVNDINKKEMHVLMTAQYTAILEMFEHNYTKEEALHLIKTVNDFFSEGWRKYLGF